MATDDDLLTRVRLARRALAANGPISVRSDGDFERVSLPYADADALRDILINERPRIVIEIGLAYASSALAIAEALVTVGSAGASHLVIDPYQQQFSHAGWDQVAGAGLDGLCSLVEQRSQIALPRLLDRGLVADAAFVDGSHIFHNVFVDLSYLRQLVRPGGLVIMDDCNWPSVATAAHYFEVNTGWQATPIRGGRRLRSFRMPDSPVDPSFESFIPFGLDRPAD